MRLSKLPSRTFGLVFGSGLILLGVSLVGVVLTSGRADAALLLLGCAVGLGMVGLLFILVPRRG